MPEIISRTEAQASGRKRYFTGETCNKGHVAERRVSDHGCVECSRLKAASPEERERRREYMRQHQLNYRRKHPDRVHATDKRSYAKRAEAITEKLREKRANNPEPFKEALRKSYRKHKARRLEESKEYKKSHPQLFAMYGRISKAKRRATEGRFSRRDVRALLTTQNHQCAVCKVDISERFEIDHIIPISRGGTNWPSNLQLLCRPCNRSKGSKLMCEWLAAPRLERISTNA